jgi:DNA-binding transcriptional LysR family regulator
MLDVRRLRVLCEVARHGSFSGAAEALGYTQPAVSRQIATLEREVGATLVRRLPQGALLTDAGRLLVQRAQTIIAQLDDAELELQSLLDLGGGRVRMVAFESAASTIVPLALMKFRARYPHVELSVRITEPIQSLPRLRAGEADVAIVNDSAWDPEQVSGVELIELFDDPMYVALPAGHPQAEVAPLGLAALGGESWMLGSSETCPDARLFHGACAGAGFVPRIALENDDYSAILGLVAAGLGIALIPEMVTRNIRDDVVIRALDPPPSPRPITVAMMADYRSAAAIAMAAVLQEVAVEWVAARAAPPVPAGVL